jgi:hypothetical protein
MRWSAAVYLLIKISRLRSDASPIAAGAIQLPDDYQPAPLDLERLPSASIQSTGLKAVVIVGDIGEYLPDVKTDMDNAVAALEAHGVVVTKFYYGDSTFDWADIVAAADGIHFLLYMGHGVFNGNCKTPASVGAFTWEIINSFPQARYVRA